MSDLRFISGLLAARTKLCVWILACLLSLVLGSCGGGSQTSSPPPPPGGGGGGGGSNLVQNAWAWIGGPNTTNQAGTYGAQGKPAASNTPGARQIAVSWTDVRGDLWLFGGYGFDSAGTVDRLNDLWKYSGGRWTWMGGSNVVAQSGVYGTQGTRAPGNAPGARYSAASSNNTSGDLWLFGGNGFDSSGSLGLLNDLWKYDGGQWTWMSGANVANQAGTYGTQGTPASSNMPGARVDAASWADGTGSFWLFGGESFDSTGNWTMLNDLWKYSAGRWTWMSGLNMGLQRGTYGTQGTPAAGNTPGARSAAVGWVGLSGDLWLFGGYGLDSAGTWGSLNDLWKYSAGQWTWMGGSDVVDQSGVYGTQGTPAPSNMPGARRFSEGCTDANGNFWLYGGFGAASLGPQDHLNDLWKYSQGQWTWMSGANVTNQPARYGTKGTGAAGNTPGARSNLVCWTDGAGNLWLFGGVGLDSFKSIGTFNDLWIYKP